MRRLLMGLLLVLAPVVLLVPSQGWGAVAYVNNGAAAAQVSVVSLPFPASIVAGNLLWVCVGNKYPTNGPALPTDAFGGTWVAPSNNQGTADPGDGPGVDLGATYATGYYKIATGTETGNLTVTATSANGIYGFIVQYTNATGAWEVAAANGGDATSGTGWSATMGSDPGITTGDLVLSCSGRNNDTGLGSSPSISTAGVTYNTHTERLDNGTSSGDDVGAYAIEHTITSGTSSGNPVVTFTNSANTAGGTVIFRIREAAAVAVAPQQSWADFLW